MAFKHELSLSSAPVVVENYVVENGQTVEGGELVQLANGVIRRAATNGAATWVGLCISEGAHVGNAAGTETVQVLVDYSAVYSVPQRALLDANVQPGDLVDITADAGFIGAAANNDFRVYHHDADGNRVFVQPVAARLMYH